MRRIVIDKLGAAPRLLRRPPDIPGPGEVALRVHACGLNFADLLMIEGRYQERREPPFTPGLEVAGEVVATGEGVEWPIGTRVAACGGHGGLADHARVPARRCVALPDTMDYVQAAGFQIAYGTSHLALTDRADLQPGETLLVLGAGGGVGLTAVEIGRLLGARVIAAARGREKLEAAAQAGAELLIDTDTEDLRAAVKAAGGAHVVYDPVGGALSGEALRATRPGGRVLVIGFASGEVPPVPANILLVKNITVHGFYWGGYLGVDPDALTASLAQLLDWFAAGRLAPQIGHVLPLERTAEGLDLLRNRQAVGKVIITMG